MAKNLKFQIKNAQLAEALKLGGPKKLAAPKKKKEEKPVESSLPAEHAPERIAPPQEAPAPQMKAEPVAQPEITPAKETPRPSHRVERQETFDDEQPPFRSETERPQTRSNYPNTGSGYTPRSSSSQPQRRYEDRRPSTPSGERPPYRSTGDRPPYRPTGDRPSTGYRPAGGGERPPYRSSADRPAAGGDRPPYRSSGDRPAGGGDRPPYRSSGDRPPYRPAGDRPPYRPAGDRPPYRPAGDRPPYERRTDRPPYQQGSSYPRTGQGGPGGAGRPAGSGYGAGAPGTSRPGYPKRDFPPRSPRPGYSTDRPMGPRPPRPPGSYPRPSGPGRPPLAPRGPETRQAPRKSSTFKDFQDLRPQRKEGVSTGFDSRDRMGLRSHEDIGWRKKRPSMKAKRDEYDETIRPKVLHIRLPVTIKDLATAMKLKSSQIISKLFMQGVIVTINDYLDDETTIQLLGQEFGCDITIDTKEEERIQITDKTIREEISEANPDVLILRPPVVTFMGHVDHGKTSLIDAIRKSDVAGGEAGAITQHIGAFRCHSPVGDITILDTPGHEAFSAMRERGADVTDLVVLVVAGDEGIREQTVEALNQAKAAKVPIMVAINKSDKPNFNPENVFRQLAEKELLPEAWGGGTVTVNCSALTGAGIPDLLEMLSLQSEVLELKADPTARARGTVIESEMHKGLGAVATLLVQNGTLRKGDAVVFDLHYARVKTMHDEHGQELTEAGPSTPVKITGLSGLPEAGSEFVAVFSEREAREIAQARHEQHKDKLQQKEKRPGGLEGLLEKRAESDKKKILNLILRADVQGSLEALKQSLQKIQTKKVDLFFVSEGVGQISESDIELAAASHSTIIGFHTKIESHAESLIKQHKVVIKLHDIIYHAVDDVRSAMRDLLDKIPQENEMGEAYVKAVFKSSQLGLIAGCQVSDGLIKRSHHIRLVRDGKVIWKGHLASLKRVKEDVREVSKGLECGILLQNFSDMKEGDRIQAYEITYLDQEL